VGCGFLLGAAEWILLLPLILVREYRALPPSAVDGGRTTRLEPKSCPEWADSLIADTLKHNNLTAAPTVVRDAEGSGKRAYFSGLENNLDGT
jgi:hypothetical protein